MASSCSKRLWEHLQEQQKPFRLDIYLSERRCMLNKNQEKPLAYDSNKGYKNLQVKKILKLITRRFADSSHSQQLSTQKDELTPTSSIQNHQQSGETGFLKFRSSVAVPVSSESGVRDSSCCNDGSSQAQKHTESNEQRAAADRERRWRCKEDEQRSPVSVLNGVSSARKEQEEYTSTSSTNSGERDEEQSITSAIMWELLIKSLIEKQSHGGIMMELQETVGPGFSVCPKSKSVLLQSRQLLFDYIREAIDTHPRKTKRKKHADQEMICPQELGKIISEKICSWGKESIAHQKHFDVSTVLQDWDYMQEFKRKMGKQIGEAIMDEMVQEVIALLLH